MILHPALEKCKLPEGTVKKRNIHGIIIRAIDGYFILILLTWTFVVIVKSAIKGYYNSRHSDYKPLLRLPSHANNYYGSTGRNTVNEDEDDDDDSETVIVDVEIKTSRWTIYNWSRLFISAIQLYLFVHHMQLISHHKFELLPNEGKRSDLVFAIGVRATLWVITNINC